VILIFEDHWHSRIRVADTKGAALCLFCDFHLERAKEPSVIGNTPTGIKPEAN
jgi:hypothetical protein